MNNPAHNLNVLLKHTRDANQRTESSVYFNTKFDSVRLSFILTFVLFVYDLTYLSIIYIISIMAPI